MVYDVKSSYLFLNIPIITKRRYHSHYNDYCALFSIFDMQPLTDNAIPFLGPGSRRARRFRPPTELSLIHAENISFLFSLHLLHIYIICIYKCRFRTLTHRRIALAAKILRQDNGSPMRMVSFKKDTAAPVEVLFRRVGRPMDAKHLDDDMNQISS